MIQSPTPIKPPPPCSQHQAATAHLLHAIVRSTFPPPLPLLPEPQHCRLPSPLLHLISETAAPDMEVEAAKCDCCGLKEDCTQDYIREVEAEFGERWLCGLCAEAVRDELAKGSKKKRGFGVEEATKAHMAFCRKFRSNPAVRVADGMRQMLRRRSSGDMSAQTPAPGRKYVRSASTSQVGQDPTVSLF